MYDPSNQEDETLSLSNKKIAHLRSCSNVQSVCITGLSSSVYNPDRVHVFHLLKVKMQQTQTGGDKTQCSRENCININWKQTRTPTQYICFIFCNSSPPLSQDFYRLSSRCQLDAVNHKTCHFIFAHTFRFSWSILIFFTIRNRNNYCTEKL